MIQKNLFDVSAIICTRNREAALARSLEALTTLDIETDTRFELVVVDNASSDDTQDIVSNFIQTAPFPVRYVLETRPGLSAARNRGLASASGDLIMFTDDDCLVAADWVTVALRLFKNNPLQVVGGRVDLFNKDHLPLTIKSSPVRETLHSANGLFGFLLGANMAFGRVVVEKIGIFDELLGAGTPLHAGEETDFVFRAFTDGIQVTYDPSLRVLHDHGRTGEAAYYKLMTGYSIGTGGLLAKWLLRGDTKLVKPLYWDIRSSIQSWRSGRQSWRLPLLKMAFIGGAWRYFFRLIVSKI
jgi:glycosyltransferase involved in cell wall biosynthesis